MRWAMNQQLAFNAATVMAPGTMLSRLQDMVIVGVIASTVFATLTSAAAHNQRHPGGRLDPQRQAHHPSSAASYPGLPGLANLFSNGRWPTWPKWC